MAAGAVSGRGALSYLGLLPARAAARQFLAGWFPSPATYATGRNGLVTLQGMSHPPEVEPAAPYAPQFFKPGEFKTVELLAEMIIPTDDKPGAKEAKVASYIDFVVFSAREFEPALQREWMDALAFLDRESQRQFGKAFRMASTAERVDLLTDMSLPERDPGARQEGCRFFQLVKNMTVEAFYTPVIGLSGELDFH